MIHLCERAKQSPFADYEIPIYLSKLEKCYVKCSKDMLILSSFWKIYVILSWKMYNT
jgi:hypothetical protein